jgi:hypothetical protein
MRIKGLKSCEISRALDGEYLVGSEDMKDSVITDMVYMTDIMQCARYILLKQMILP